MANDIREAFTDEGVKSYANDFLAQLREQIGESEKLFRRTCTYVIALGFFFELTGQGNIEEVNLAFAKITNLDVIRIVMPLAIAYFYSEALAAFVNYTYVHGVYDTTMQEKYPALEKPSLVGVLVPTNSVLLGGSARAISSILPRPVEKRRRAEFFIRFGFWVRALLLLIGPLLFELYAFFELFRDPGPGNFFLWFSLVASFWFIVDGLGNLGIVFTGDGPE